MPCTTSRTRERFTCDGQLYEVRRLFDKVEGWRPPALSGDYYQPVATSVAAAQGGGEGEA